MPGGRIEHGPVSYYSIVLGAIGVIAVGAGVFFYSHIQSQKIKNKTYDPNQPLPSEAEIRRTIGEDQYKIVRQNGTETAFRNAYWDEKRPGIYVDVISGQPLFSSLDKYDAGNGRPTFMKPIDKSRIESSQDNSFGMNRVEIHAKKSGAHLGHWFADPTTPTGERYALNSAGLHFIPADSLSQEGYNEFVPLFKGAASASPSPSAPSASH